MTSPAVVISQDVTASSAALGLWRAVVTSPIGDLVLFSTAEGVIRLSFGTTHWDVVEADTARRLKSARKARSHPDVVGTREDELAEQAHAHVEAGASWLRQYFSGEEPLVETRGLDRRISSGFYREVLDELAKVPYGHRVTYTELAALAGRPRAVRAVATACATNPLPLFIPCHRVVRSDGSLGGFLGGLDVKRELLAMEATHGGLHDSTAARDE